MGAKETSGRTAFELAAIHGHHQLVGKKQEKLWRSSSIPPRPDLHVVTARDVSMWPRPRRVHWSDVNQKRLRTNAAHGNWTQVRALLDAGADPDAEDEFGRTAADLAEAKGHMDIVSELKDAERHPELPFGVPSQHAYYSSTPEYRT